MLTEERLDRLEKDATENLELKLKEAKRGHDWVVPNHTISSFELLELVAVAKVGLPHWLRRERKERPSYWVLCYLYRSDLGNDTCAQAHGRLFTTEKDAETARRNMSTPQHYWVQKVVLTEET